MKQVKRRKYQHINIKQQNIISDKSSTLERTAMDVLMAISNQVQPEDIDQNIMKTQEIKDTKKTKKPRKLSYEEKYQKELNRLFVEETQQAKKRSVSTGPKQPQILKQKNQQAINLKTPNLQDKPYLLKDNSILRSTFLRRLTPSKQMIIQRNTSHSLMTYKRIRSVSNPLQSHQNIVYPNRTTSFKFITSNITPQQSNPFTKKLSRTTLYKHPLQICNKQSCSMFRQKNKYSVVNLEFPLSSKSKTKKLFFN